ncbi:MAG: hypothetical protein PUC94_05640, partial [Bacteroidales bacterium]|nr:hypothetical protein [Bacteroidales bacterium]
SEKNICAKLQNIFEISAIQTAFFTLHPQFFFKTFFNLQFPITPPTPPKPLLPPHTTPITPKAPITPTPPSNTLPQGQISHKLNEMGVC